jgi:hypothetical protein
VVGEVFGGFLCAHARQLVAQRGASRSAPR